MLCQEAAKLQCCANAKGKKIEKWSAEETRINSRANYQKNTINKWNLFLEKL